jgi:hypothetical protein
VTYQITVERKGTGNEVALTVDSQAVPGKTVPLPPPAARLAGTGAGDQAVVAVHATVG